jgi:xylose isomerase
MNGMLGSVDANQGDELLGWDTDQFPFDVYDTTLCMYEVLKAGGIPAASILTQDAASQRTPMRTCSWPSSGHGTVSRWG